MLQKALLLMDVFILFLYFRCEFTNKTQMFPFCIDVEDKFEEEVNYREAQLPYQCSAGKRHL